MNLSVADWKLKTAYFPNCIRLDSSISSWAGK